LQDEQYLHMSITQLTSSALKTTSLVKTAFVSEIMGRIRQLFPWKQVVRIGWTDGGLTDNRLSSKSLMVKGRPTLHLSILPRNRKKLAKQRPPDWIEARSIIRASGSILTPLLICDNNIGMVTNGENKIMQKFLIRKEGTSKLKVYETVVELDHNRNKLDKLVSAKIDEFAGDRSFATMNGDSN
jgi:hypothetical protein